MQQQLRVGWKKKRQKLFQGAKKVNGTFNSENGVLNMIVNVRRNEWRYSDT